MEEAVTALHHRYGRAQGPKEYVRLTYKPAGARRSVTVWARVVRRSPERVVYRQVSEEGDETFGEGTATSPEQTRLIVATPAEVREKPARMNLHYGMLEVARPETLSPAMREALLSVAMQEDAGYIGIRNDWAPVNVRVALTRRGLIKPNVDGSISLTPAGWVAIGRPPQ